MKQPFGLTTFCDDIRHEINGKMTLIGCYGAELIFTANAPENLPTFAALINIRIPTNYNAEKIRIYVIKEEEEEITEILNTEISLEKTEELETKDQKNVEVMNALILPCMWSPMPFKGNGFVKVRAVFDEKKEVKLGALRILFPDTKENNENAGDT